jgi:hypothetical protein
MFPTEIFHTIFMFCNETNRHKIICLCKNLHQHLKDKVYFKHPPMREELFDSKGLLVSLLADCYTQICFDSLFDHDSNLVYYILDKIFFNHSMNKYILTKTFMLTSIISLGSLMTCANNSIFYLVKEKLNSSKSVINKDYFTCIDSSGCSLGISLCIHGNIMGISKMNMIFNDHACVGYLGIRINGPLLNHNMNQNDINNFLLGTILGDNMISINSLVTECNKGYFNYLCIKYDMIDSCRSEKMKNIVELLKFDQTTRQKKQNYYTYRQSSD